MPFDVAFSLDDDERMAWVVVFGTLSGRRFDWISMSWDEGTA